jgi:hypothetical protein
VAHTTAAPRITPGVLSFFMIFLPKRLGINRTVRSALCFVLAAGFALTVAVFLQIERSLMPPLRLVQRPPLANVSCAIAHADDALMRSSRSRFCCSRHSSSLRAVRLLTLAHLVAKIVASCIIADATACGEASATLCVDIIISRIT